MKTHAILELEEGTLNVVVGARDGNRTRLLRQLRMPLPDLGRETVSNALRGVTGEMLQGADGVHVVVGDRRAQHFLSTLPKSASKDAVDFVTREALRLTNLPSADDVLVATRLVRRLAGNKLLLGTSALSRSVWAPLQAAFEENGMKVLGLHTMESCMAMACDPDFTEPVAVLECSGGRARYVLCVDQTPIQVRRFLIGVGEEQNEAALTTQLAMELPRTLDWLRETGQPLPKQLLVGSRVGIDDESLAMLASDEIDDLRRARPDVICEDDVVMPNLGMATLLERLAGGAPLPSLLDPPKLRMPMGAGRMAGVLAATSLGVLASYSAVVDGSAWLEARDENAAICSQCDDIQLQIDELAIEEGGGASPANPHLQHALSMRRPISRLLAEVSNSCGSGLHLDEVQFASRSPVVVSGHVEAETRQQALATMAAFVDKVHALPYLEARGQEEVSEVLGKPNYIRFRMSLAWRNQ